MLNVDEFLSAAGKAGDYQSEGEFTLSARESLTKLSKYQLGQPGLWLVKLVQCAGALGAPHVTVKRKGDGLRVSLGADIGMTAKELWEAILDPSRALKPAHHHLVVGMRALYGQHDELAWVCADHQQATMVALRGESIEERTVADSPGAGFQLAINRGVNVGERVSGWLGRSLSELQAVRDFCWLAPMRVYLDDKELGPHSGGEHKILARWEVGLANSDLPKLLMRRTPAKGEALADKNGFTYWNPTPKKGRPYLDHRIDQDGDETYLGMLLTLEAGSGAESCVRYIHHGAIVEGPSLRLSLTDGYAICVYAPVDELQVDMSEFKTGERKSEILSRAYGQAIAMMGRFLDCLEGRLGSDGERDPHIAGAGASLATIATFMKSKALLIGLVGVPMSLVIGGGVVTAKKMSSYHRNMEKLDMTNVLKAATRQLERQSWVEGKDVSSRMFYRAAPPEDG